METPGRFKFWTLGLAIGMLAALLLWPATRWIPQSQFALLLPPSVTPLAHAGDGLNPGDATPADSALHAARARFPNDYPVLLADAAQSRPGETNRKFILQRLRALEPRFLASASLRANILRLATLEEIKIEREGEESALLGSPASEANPTPDPAKNTPEMLARIDQEAAEGENLDPENAYFPMMRAIGLFAAHRDDEALAALRRASEKPEWNEYYADQVEGEWRTQEAAFGHSSAFAHVLSSAAVLFPHLAQIRAAARLAIFKAVEAEQAGQVETGLAIRLQVMRCGSRMRVHASSLIGNMVGIAITRLALMRPGGAPAADYDRPNSGIAEGQDASREQKDALRLNNFESYLQRIGHTEATDEIRAEMEAGTQARTMTRRGLENSPFDRPLRQLMLWWAADMLTLSAALWVSILGGIAALLARKRWVREGRPLAPDARVGVGFALLSGCMAAASWLVAGLLPVPFYVTASVTAGGLGALLVLRSKRPLAERFRNLGLFALGVLSVGGSAIALYSQVGTAVGPLIWFCQTVLQGGEGANSNAASDRQAMLIVAVGIVAVVPYALLITVAAVSRWCRVPLTVGVVRGVRGSAVPVASVLILLYGGLVIGTVRQERIVTQGLNATLHHEGQYIAESLGEKWPGQAR